MMKLCYFDNNLFFSSYVCRWHDHGSTLCVWWCRWKRSINDVWREDADSLSATFTAEWRRSSSGFLKYPTLQCTVLCRVCSAQFCSAQCSVAHSALQRTVLCSVAVQFSVAHSALQWLKCPIANSKYILGISWDAGVAPHFWCSDTTALFWMECKCAVGLICRNVQSAIVFTTLHYTERWYEHRCLSFSTFLHIFLTVLQPLDARIRSHRNLILKVGTYDPLLKLRMLSLVTIYWIHE